jgi:hypothetical protein
MNGRAEIVKGSGLVARDPERRSGLRPAPGHLPHPPRPWPQSSLLTLGALKTAPGCARLHVNAVLHEWGMERLAESAEIMTTELVTNAVLASTTPDQLRAAARSGNGLAVVHLRLLSDGTRVVIEVWDSVPHTPVARKADVDDESGRGLMLVEALCTQWGCSPVPGWPGKVVWAELAAANQP